MAPRHNLNRLVHFVAVVEEGGITAAAARLGVSKAVVSKHVQLLEQEAGVSLLNRNTRHVQLTEAGRAFHERCGAALAQVDEAFELLRERGTVPTGLIRVTAPVDYGAFRVAPLVAAYCERHPRVEVDFVMSDERIDIVEQRFDLAFRIGWLADSGNRARKLRDFTEIVVCSPATATRHRVARPDDLTRLPFIASRALGDAASWSFTRGEQSRTVAMRTVMTMNGTLAIRNAVMHGGGMAILPDFLVAGELADGRLIRLLPEWSLRSGGVYAVSPPSRLRTRAVTAFLEMVVAAHADDG